MCKTNVTNLTGDLYLLATLEYMVDWLIRVINTAKEINIPFAIAALLARMRNDQSAVFT